LTLKAEEQGQARNKAYDLLDALTKGGAYSIDYATLHVFIAVTHCFEKSVMNTLVQDNVNPIEKLERTSLIVGQTLFQQSAAELIASEQLERAATYSPQLFPGHAKAAPMLEDAPRSSSSSLLPTYFVSPSIFFPLLSSLFRLPLPSYISCL